MTNLLFHHSQGDQQDHLQNQFRLSSEGNSARDGCRAGSNGITLKLRADNFFFGSSDIRARFAWRLLIWYNAEPSMTKD